VDWQDEREDRRGEELTRWRHTIVLVFVILVALVGGGKVMFATEIVFAMLAFEGQEIDEVAVLSGALVPDGEECSRVCGHECGVEEE
jgi:hypothetical protein